MEFEIAELGRHVDPLTGSVSIDYKIQAKPGSKIWIGLGEDHYKQTNTLRFTVVIRANRPDFS